VVAGGVTEGGAVTRVLIEDPADPRLDGYRALRDPGRRREIDRDQDVFVAEGPLVIEALVASRYRLQSVLASPARADLAEALLAGVDAPLFVAPADVLAEAAGFDLHRGLVALGQRAPLADPETLVAAAHLLLVVEGVNDHENLGALYRNAAAFGVDAVLLDPTTADPLYRRCLRVSMGHALGVPTGRLRPWPDALAELSADGWVVLALTPDRSAEPIDAAVAALVAATDLAAVTDRTAGASVEAGSRPRVALLVGAEGPGLSAAALAAATGRVRIPMARRVDSLNVATAAAVALHRLAGLS
jgi:tRNA G18 (ribose-2'-O)-methylase SpoU